MVNRWKQLERRWAHKTQVYAKKMCTRMERGAPSIVPGLFVQLVERSSSMSHVSHASDDDDDAKNVPGASLLASDRTAKEMGE